MSGMTGTAQDAAWEFWSVYGLRVAKVPTRRPDARLFEEPGEGEFGGQVHVMALPGPDPIRRRALESAGALVHGGRGMDRHTLDLRDLWTWLDFWGVTVSSTFLSRFARISSVIAILSQVS